MKITKTEIGSYLRHPEGYFIQVDGALNIKDELGRIGYCRCDYQCEDYKLVFPKPIQANRAYQIRASKDFKWLTLIEKDGECKGFRHRFSIYDYGVRVPFVCNSIDPRVKEFCGAWRIRSGQFFTKLFGKWAESTAIFSYEIGKTPTLKLELPLEWMNIPAQ